MAPRANLPTFGSLLRDSWALIRHRLQGLAVLTLFPVALLVFLSPWTSVWSAWFVAALRGMNAPDLPDFAHLVVLLGTVGAFIVWNISLAGSFAYLADPVVRGGRLALRRGLERWLPVTLTELLISVILAASTIPTVVVYFVSLAPRIIGNVPPLLGHYVPTALLGAFVSALFLVPTVILAVRYVFAPLVVATGGRSGPAALAASEAVVRGNFWPILRLLVLWLVVRFAFATMVSPLPILHGLVPLAVLTVFDRAYLVALYRAFLKP